MANGIHTVEPCNSFGGRPSRSAMPNRTPGTNPAEANTVATDFFEALPPGMAELEEQLRRVAPQDTTLLFTGETGTGKTRLARVIHELLQRRGEPFLVIH